MSVTCSSCCRRPLETIALANPRFPVPFPLPFSVETTTVPQQSQSYLFFWDKFEKCNYFLENVLLTKDRPLDGRLLQHLLKEPICDGGGRKCEAAWLGTVQPRNPF